MEQMGKRVFITFAAGEEYEKLSQVLKRSIESFSGYDLIIYRPEDFDIIWQPENWQPAYIFIYKVLSCLKSLENFDEIVWLDNDCLPTKNIDKIWNYQVDNYPLLPKERFNNFRIWPNEKPNYQDTNLLKTAKEKVGLAETDFSNHYLQACCMLFNKSCINFFQEVLKYYQDFDNDIFPYGDESIINCLLWREKSDKNLGDVFLCSIYFSPYILEAVINAKSEEEYANLFDINHRISEIEDTFILFHGWSLARHNRIGLIDNNFNNLLFFHGNKSADQHSHYLDLMLK